VIAVPLLVEWSVHQQVDDRHGFVAWHEAFAEITQEVVGTRLGPLRDQAAARLGESVLHSQAWKCGDDATDIGWVERVEEETAVIESDANRAEGTLRICVKR